MTEMVRCARPKWHQGDCASQPDPADRDKLRDKPHYLCPGTVMVPNASGSVNE